MTPGSVASLRFRVGGTFERTQIRVTLGRWLTHVPGTEEAQPRFRRERLAFVWDRGRAGPSRLPSASMKVKVSARATIGSSACYTLTVIGWNGGRAARATKRTCLRVVRPR